MNKKIIAVTVIAFTLVGLLGTFLYNADAETPWQTNKNAAHEAAELMRSRGYDDDNPVIQAASKWWWAEDADEKAYETENLDERNVEPPEQFGALDLAEVREVEIPAADPEPALYYTEEQYAQYPVACECYQYLRESMGLSREVACGIIGGWMEESGGQTLSINPNLWVGSGMYAYGGIAMWSLYYCPEVYGMTLQQQLEYFGATCQKNIEYFGGSYDYFTSLGDPGSVVSYYYSYYGRGYGSAGRQRIQNGWTAYNYFTL